MKPLHLLVPTISALLGAPLLAGTTAIPTGPEPVMTTTTDSGWEFTLGLYGWGAGLNGDLGVAGFTVPVDISFDQIVESLDMTAMGMVELRKGRWLFQLEGLYLRNSVKQTAFTPIRNTPVQAKLTAETTRLEAVAGYRVVDTDRTRVDLLAGCSYYDIDNELRLIGNRNAGSASSGEGWVDPIVGVRLNQRLTGPWSLQLRGDVGGFGVSSDIVWQAVGMISYDLSPGSTLFAGWRHAAVDYQKGNFIYDVASSGPILGLALTF